MNMDKFLHPEYKEMQERWQMCRDASDGEHAVHSRGEAYLPKLEEETKSSYRMRLLMTPFFGATWRTIITLRGMMFRKNPTIVGPDAMMIDIENIDHSGQSIVSFCQEVALEALTVGRCGVLVDYSAVPDNVTEADARDAGARAFMRAYTAENILDWRYRNAGGKKLLSMVRLMENEVNHDDIELKQNEQLHKILEITGAGYVQRLVKIDDNGDEEQIGDEVIPKMHGQSLSFIPFQCIGVDALDMRVEIPSLMDLVTMNYHHYRQSSSYERGCFISGLPTLFVFGNHDDEKVIYVGGSKANSFPDPQARAEFVEVHSNFEALVTNLKEKEHQMAVLGARMLESQRSGVESEGALARKQSGEESVLADISTTVSNGMTNCLRWFADWQGYLTDDIRFELTKDFLPFAMNAQEITALFSAYIGKGLSYDALYYNYQRAGLYPPGSTMEEERGKIDEGTPGMA